MEERRSEGKLTLAAQRCQIEEACRIEINEVLKSRGCTLIPTITIGPNGVVGAAVNIRATN